MAFQVGVTQEFLEKHGYESGMILNLATNVDTSGYQIPPSIPLATEETEEKFYDAVEEIPLSEEFKEERTEENTFTWLGYILELLFSLFFGSVNEREDENVNVRDQDTADDKTKEKVKVKKVKKNRKPAPVSLLGQKLIQNEDKHDAKCHVVRLISLGPSNRLDMNKVYYNHEVYSDGGSSSHQDYSDVLFLALPLAEFFGISKKLNPFYRGNSANEKFQRFEFREVEDIQGNQFTTSKILSTNGQYKILPKAQRVVLYPIKTSKQTALGTHNLLYDSKVEIDGQKDVKQYFSKKK